MSQAEKVHDLTAEEVAAGIAQGRYLLIDVREPNEVAAEAYPDAVVLPLSTFDPAEIRPSGQDGGFCLPLRQAFGHGIIGRPGWRQAVRQMKTKKKMKTKTKTKMKTKMKMKKKSQTTTCR